MKFREIVSVRLKKKKKAEKLFDIINPKYDKFSRKFRRQTRGIIYNDG